MRKNLSFLILILIVPFLPSCTPKESTIKECLTGTWVLEQINNKDVLTDDLIALTFNGQKTETYASGYAPSETNKFWDETNFNYSVKDNIISINGTDRLNNKIELDLKIKEISSTKMKYVVNKYILDGEAITNKNTYSYYKSKGTYNTSILGLWEGRNVTPGITGADTLSHRWEFIAGGGYKYYIKTDGQWVPKEDNFGKFFLYEDLLATNWTNDFVSGKQGTLYECWMVNITSSSDGIIMNWEGRRSTDQANGFAYFWMKKVQ